MKFNIVYDGMERFCHLCQKKHGKECPSKIRWEALKKLRKGKNLKRKLYSDSSLSRANQLALSTDVACMSGGGIGKIVNAIPLDEKRDDVVIYAGNNEITSNGTLEEFAYTVSQASEKLKKLAAERNVTLVLPCVPTAGASEAGKAEYLTEKMCEIKEIKTIKLSDVEYDNQYHPHPTIAGTVKILETIHRELNNEIILEGNNTEDLTTHRKYYHVQPIYKVGCRGCDSFEYTPSLCAECLRKAETFNVESLEQKIEKLHKEQYPDVGFGVQNNEIQMRDILKRPLEESDGDKHPKNARNESA